MEAAATTNQLPLRAQLHELIDQIQDPEILRAALLLLAPQVATEPELSPAWQARLDQATQELDEGKGILAAEVLARLLAATPA